MPTKMAATSAAAEAMPWRPRAWTARAICRWVTCAISCASTLASCASFEVAVMRPWLRPMKPPGSAKALMLVSRTTKNRNRRCESGTCEAMRLPSDWM